MQKKNNWESTNMVPLTEQIKAKIIEQLIIKKREIDSLNDIEVMKKFKGECSLCMEKLNFVEKANLFDYNKYNNYLKIISKIDDIDYVDEMKKVKMILSYSVLVNYFDNINKLKDEEIILLSACSTDFDIEDYTYYIGILSNETVVSEIVSSSQDFNEQLNLCYSIMDFQDEYQFDSITTDNYEPLVQNNLKVINEYSNNYKK